MTLIEIVFSLSLGLFGAAAMGAIYFLFRSEWPLSYLALSQTYAMRATASIPRLALFRFVPIAMIAWVVSASATRIGANSLLSVGAAVLIHLVGTNFKAVIESNSRRTAANYTTYHVIASSLVAFAGSIGWALGVIWPDPVPVPEEILRDLWLGFFVSIIGGLFFALIKQFGQNDHTFDTAYLSERANRDIGIGLVDYAWTSAIGKNADPILVRSIMQSESLQRPRWFRRLERLRGRFVGRGTYGVMQVKSDKPISDRASIDLVADRYSGVACLNATNGVPSAYPDSALIWSQVSLHNADKSLIDSVTDLYHDTFHRCRLRAVSRDQSQEFGIIEVRRYGARSGVRGCTSSELIELRIVREGKYSIIGLAARPKETQSRYWFYEIDIDTSESPFYPYMTEEGADSDWFTRPIDIV